MTRPLVLIGASGHAREVLQLVLDINKVLPTWHIEALIADDHGDADPRFGDFGLYEVLPVGALDSFRGSDFVVAIGSGEARLRMARHAERAGLGATTLVHPTAQIGIGTPLSEGTVVFAFSAITTHVTMGRHVLINRSCSVGHDAVLQDGVTLHPGAVVSGAATVGTCSTIGSGATLIPGVHVGADAVIGAGGVVVTDVQPGVTAVGVPARPVVRDAVHTVDATGRAAL